MAEPVRIVASVDELLSGVTDRAPLLAEDGKSGNWLERVTIDGQSLVVKHLTYDGDWIMRVMGDRVFWAYRAAQAGLFDRWPPTIDHAVVGLALDGEGPTGELVFLMHDVGAQLIPEGDSVVAVAHHRELLTHMAQMHAAAWNWVDDVGLQTMAQRILPFAPRTIAPELSRPEPRPVPLVVASQGWACLPELAPGLAEVVFDLHRDPTPLTDALTATPTTFLHGDWKMGNLGRHPDGRTILLDWAYLGAGPPLWDLMWYLALNRARLPESKERSIDGYRAALEAAGVATDPWWDRQLALATVAIMVCFAWEKAVGDPAELAWWVDRVAAARWAM